MQVMLLTFVYTILWILLVAGFGGILVYHMQARLVCDEFESNSDTGHDNPSNCFHYIDNGKCKYIYMQGLRNE